MTKNNIIKFLKEYENKLYNMADVTDCYDDDNIDFLEKKYNQYVKLYNRFMSKPFVDYVELSKKYWSIDYYFRDIATKIHHDKYDSDGATYEVITTGPDGYGKLYGYEYSPKAEILCMNIQTKETIMRALEREKIPAYNMPSNVSF